MPQNPTPKLLESFAELRDQGVQFLPISKLKPWAGNPNRHDPGTPRLVRLIQRFGWTQPAIIRREADGDSAHEVSAGHGRAFEAAVELGLEEIPVIFRNFSEHESHAYGLADNKASEFSEDDEGALQSVIDELVAADGLQDVLDAGYTEDELIALGSLPELPAGPDDSETGSGGDKSPPAEPARKEPVSKPGDVWELGEHLLTCGEFELAHCDAIVWGWEKRTGKKAARTQKVIGEG